MYNDVPIGIFLLKDELVAHENKGLCSANHDTTAACRQGKVEQDISVYKK